MTPPEKFSFLRTILKTFGLSPEAIDDITDRISDFLSEKDPKAPVQQIYPYFLRDDFVSKAEHSFFMVLKTIVPDSAFICTKVSLGDLFYVKSSDNSEFRIYTNKIDRKHVDFLLCDAKTMHPIAGIELDDKSHQRADRVARDEFVEEVFRSAKLPLLRFPAKFGYSAAELSAVLKPYLGQTAPAAALVPPAVMEKTAAPVPVAEPKKAVAEPTVGWNVSAQSAVEKKNACPACPKCGAEMVLRTARSGANQGEQFWGCPDYPKCRGVVKLEKA